jgi:hypothetical protein
MFAGYAYQDDFKKINLLFDLWHDCCNALTINDPTADRVEK